MTTSWVDAAEAALSGGAKDDSIRVLRGTHPRVLDQEGVKALLSPFMAALVWAAAVLREMMAGSSLDPMAVIFRLLALGLTVRVLLLGWTLLHRSRVWVRCSQYALVLTTEGLFYRSPEMDIVVPKSDVVGVIERGQWQTRRSGGRRWSEVFVVTNPASGRTHLALPPVFDSTPGQLAERLMRWRGAPPEATPPDAPEAELASQVWQDAAKGKQAPGTTVLRLGWEWLKTGPYLGIVVAVIAIEGLLRAGPGTLDALGPMFGGGLVLAVLLIPARWFQMYRKEIKPSQGVSMLLTPAEILIRMHIGMLRTRYAELATVRADQKRTWSVLEGAHSARELVLTRTNKPVIRYPEPNLGAPVEVVQLLIEAYRSGQLPRPQGGAPRRPPTEEEE